MKVDRWLALNRKGTGRLSQKQPALGPGEIAIRLSFEIPDAYFTVPTITARITAKDPRATTVEAETLALMEDAILKATGIPMVVSLTINEAPAE